MTFEGINPRIATSAEAKKHRPTEEDFLRGMERLQREKVPELAKKWEAEYERLIEEGAEAEPLADLFSRFADFEARREDALFSLEIPKGLDEHLVAELKEFDKNVVLSFRSPSLFQGNGGTAEVYEMLGHPNMCVKFITNQTRYNEHNHMRTEFEILDQVSGLRAGRVRTPTPYFLRIHPREGHSYGMEKIDGKSFSQILEKPHEHPDLISVAKGLERNKVLGEVIEFIRVMHGQGVRHNDLFRRNLMLDKNGTIFIIDFGRAKSDTTDRARGMQEDSDLALVEAEIRAFFAGVDKIEI